MNNAQISLTEKFYNYLAVEKIHQSLLLPTIGEILIISYPI